MVLCLAVLLFGVLSMDVLQFIDLQPILGSHDQLRTNFDIFGELFFNFRVSMRQLENLAQYIDDSKTYFFCFECRRNQSVKETDFQQIIGKRMRLIWLFQQVFIQDPLGCLYVKVSFYQAEHFLFCLPISGYIYVAFEKGGEVMKLGRIDFFILHADKQTCDGQIILGKGGFFVVESMKTVDVEGSCMKEGGGAKSIVEVDAAVLEEGSLERSSAI